MMASISVNSAKVGMAIPRNQWPKRIDGAGTAERVILRFTTPEGLAMEASVKGKSFRKAQTILRAIEAEGGTPVIFVQGRLMPGLILQDAGIAVQRKGSTPPA